MRIVEKIFHWLWEKVAVGLMVAYVLLPSSPTQMPLASSDSGVFLYIGWRILNGELPYLNIWDHKPPLIYYLNALGLALADSSRWGVWLLEFIAVFLAAWMGYALIKMTMGRLPAFFTLALWLLTLFFVLDGGNLPEEFALPLQFGCLWLILSAETTRKGQRSSFYLIGLLTGAAFFFKQTSIGVGLAIALYLFGQRLASKRYKDLAQQLLWLTIGAFSVALPIVLFFSSQGALGPFIDAAFRYNVIYSLSNATLLSHFIPVTHGISPLTTVGLFQLGVIGYGIALYLILSKNPLVKNWKALLIVCLINLPVELLLVSTSGNLFVHYYMALIPALGVFAALVYWLVLLQLAQVGMAKRLQAALTLAAILALVWSTVENYQITVRENTQVQNIAAIPFIEANTAPEDTVLLWGAEAATNFYSRRASPTRYVYQFPLYKVNYANEGRILAFLDEILEKRPKFIFDTRNKGAPMFEFPVESTAIQQAVKAIQANYRKVDNLGAWRVYELQNP